MYNNYNPYYTQPMRTYQPMEQTPQYIPPVTNQPIQKIGLQGKSVDSLEVVKAVEFPLDGSVSYFPLTDGSAIVTKQLQTDGTSKITIYKPTEETKNKTEYITKTDLESALRSLEMPDVKSIKEDIKSLKKQIRGIIDDMGENND